ncbi:glycosyltransferase family 4 protein [Caulobacter sp. RL271]|jgi:glycosyltransferase involved in cell wall biosynthesis|uniref:Glycosyltransferase family 4 protein n=1 Tax=Caulobacter segnis TaxID=88688 RepID=A0ABY4ZXF4_9CAUL|nr:glycosyltransferase family 4 protein [Caulobacter segnis]USQ97425.1 glycosyltransferase family 4 protein [Caulobacter segnis]
MKICWVTPFALRSSIGRVSAAVTEQLAARGHQVEILRCEDQDDPAEPLHPTALPVHHWRRYDLSGLRTAFDVVVVNIGDNYPFHAGVFAVLDAAPCLGIFHDFYIYNLFSGWLHHNGLDYRRHDAEIVATYGPQAEPHAVAVRSGQMLDMGEIAQHLPMTEWLAGRCEAALAHAQFYAPKLEAVVPGPVAVTPLCCPDRATPPGPPKAKTPLTLTTVGVMNPNKRVADVIRAIGGSDALKACAYRLVGPISDDERAALEGVAAEVGFANLVIDGAVDDETLDRRLDEADIMVALRKPVLEGASGSACEGMLSGRPTVVARAGFYGELPDDLVFKIDGEIVIEELREVLERLVADETLRRRTGQAARAWALETLNAARYAEAVDTLAQAQVTSRPLLAVGVRLGHELRGMGLADTDPATARIGATLQTLFAPIEP